MENYKDKNVTISLKFIVEFTISCSKWSKSLSVDPVSICNLYNEIKKIMKTGNDRF